MSTSNSKMTFQGNPISVEGAALEVGGSLPEFSLVGVDMSPVTKSDFENNVVVVLSVPSLDTPVCSTEVKKFSEEVVALGDGVKLLAVSRDLPFAQSRWCAAQEVESVLCASDYKERSFGKSFGTDIPEMGLLARAVFVTGKDGKLVHVDYVEELSEEPDYQAALDAARSAL